VTEDDDALDAIAEVAGDEQLPVGRNQVRSEAGPGCDLGQQRSAQSPRRLFGICAGARPRDDDGPRMRVQLDREGRGRMDPGSGFHLGQQHRCRQRIAECEVHVHRPRDPGENAGGEVRSRGGVVATLLGSGNVHRPGGGTEDAGLPRRLVGPDAEQLGRPVRREEDQRDAGMRRLEHGRMEFGDGGAGGRDDEHRSAGFDREPDREESR
jgi:hypothetical protein